MAIIVNPQSEMIRDSGLLKIREFPKGSVRLNPDQLIPKSFFIMLNEMPGQHFRDLTGRATISVNDNHGIPPYEHWHYHPEGIWNYYGGNLVDAELLEITGVVNSVGNSSSGILASTAIDPIYMGGIFELLPPDSANTKSYNLVGETDPPTTGGHMTGVLTCLAVKGNTTIGIYSGSGEALDFTVPNLRDGRTHCAIAKCWHDGSVGWAQLFLDGVEYAAQANTNYRWFYRTHWAAVTAVGTHHNRVLDGVVKAVWVSHGPSSNAACIEESRDPFMALVPA